MFSNRKYAEQLGLPYSKYRRYIKTLKSKFSRDYRLATSQKSLHRRVWYVDDVGQEKLAERCGDKEVPYRALGWTKVENRNGMLIFRHDLGSVFWYQNGTVRLNLRGEVHLGHVKTLFSRAFHEHGILSMEEMEKAFNSLQEGERHHYYELGVRLPVFTIRDFEPSHGLTIKSDGSHPTGIEVEERSPFWLDSLERVQLQFAENIEEHLKLIKEYQEEAKQRRRKGLLRRLFEWLI